MSKLAVLFITIGGLTLLTGCQSTKGIVNGFSGGGLVTATLPTDSTSRVQFIAEGKSSNMRVSPNSTWSNTFKAGAGLVLKYTTYGKKTTLNQDLGLSKLTVNQRSRYKELKSGDEIITSEQYVTSNEPLSFTYNGQKGRKACLLSGHFISEKNMDYRIVGTMGEKTCHVKLEKIITNSDGSISLETITYTPQSKYL